MKKLLLVLAVSSLLFGCKPEGRIFEEHQALSPKVEWKKEDVREFKVPIEDNGIDYALSIGFRYAQGFPWNATKIKVTEVSPSGKKTEKEYELKIRDEQGEYIGDPGFDIWDSSHLVEKAKKYEETGTYTYIFEHNMPKDPFPFAMEIGLILDKEI